MATQLYTSPDGARLVYHSRGALAAFDRHAPIPDKNEWGADTIQRTMYVPAPVLAAFRGTHRQGSVFVFDGVQYFLQTLQPSPASPDSEWSMTYLGFSRGLPDPLPENDRCELVSSLSAEGLSVTYGENVRFPDGSLARRKIIAATSQVRYLAPQTTWRYINNGMPNVPRNLPVYGAGVQVLDESTILSFNDGSTELMTGTAPAAVATALFRTPAKFTIGPSSIPIVGTPYWMCMEAAQLKYPGS